jgi:Zn-dependent protease with chaperone function
MDQAQPEAVAGRVGRRLRRSFDATAMWQLGVLVVAWAGGALLIGFVAGVLRPVTGVDTNLVIGVWTAAGVLVFLPPVEVVLSRALLGFRRPTPDQLAVLQAAWARVCAQAGVRGGRYVLRVQPRAALNAAAGGGHIVGVSATALALPPRYLEAVLAHELGHHIGGHAMMGMLLTWYSWPLRTLVRISMWVGRMATLFMTLLRPLAGVLAVVLLPFALLSCVGSLLVPLVALPVTVSIVVMRRSELRADVTAARLGYGAELLELYRGWAAREPPLPGAWRSFKAFFQSTHPRFDVRVRNLERLLAVGPPRPA